MSNETAQPAAPAIPAWRYKTGLGLFVLGNILVVLSLVVAPALGVSAAYIGIAVIVSEVITLCSVFFLGWSGLKQLKSQMLAFLKFNPDAPPVGRFRHNLGIWMTFVLPMALDVAAIVLVFVNYARATPADPFPLIWGLNHGQLGWTVAGLFIASYISLVAGTFVLGDHWWGRFREVFVWQGRQ